MGDGFRIDPDALTRAADKLHVHADEVEGHGRSLAAKTGGRVGHGPIGQVAEDLVKRGIRGVSEGVSKAVADFHRGSAKGLKAVAARTREADARAAQGFKDLEHSDRNVVPRPGHAPAQKLLGPGAPTTQSLRDVQALPHGPSRGKPAELYFRQLYKGGPEATNPRLIPTLGHRRVDVPTHDMAIEIKNYGGVKTVGGRQQHVRLTPRLREEIAKDTYLRHKDPSYRPVWMFSDAPPSAELLALLKARNIEVVQYGRG